MSAEIFMMSMKRHQSTWMDRPGDWVWESIGGQLQGFGLSWRDNVGLANLLWLAMDMEAPPKIYHMRTNVLATLLTMHGGQMKLGGLPLFDQSASLTLAQFRNALTIQAFEAPPPCPNISPVLTTLANGRLVYANS